MSINKRKFRDLLRLVSALCMGWLYVPHICLFLLGNKRLEKNSGGGFRKTFER